VSTLVIHPGPLGDLLLAAPALRALRAATPAAPLVLAAQPRLGALLAALGLVDRHLAFEGLGLERLFVTDGASPDALRAATRIVCWFGARDGVFARRLAEVAPGAVLASPTGDRVGLVWEHLLATVGAPAGPWCQPLAVPAALAGAGRAALERAGWDGGTPLLMAHAGAGSPGKRWPVEGFAEVLAAVRRGRALTIVLNEGPADREAVAALAPGLGGQARVLRGLTLLELAGALAHARAYLGNDSGPSHLAAALGVPALILYEQASLAWRPWSPAAEPVTVTPARVDRGDVAVVSDRLTALLG
jgi:ADP-heptose:LPS heptosyltransferase